MHLGKFHEAVKQLYEEHHGLSIPHLFEMVIGRLADLTQNPGNVQIAEGFRDQLEQLRQALANAGLNAPYPTLAAMLASIGAQDFIGDKLFNRVEEELQDAGMSAQLAIIGMTRLKEEVFSFYDTIGNIYQGFQALEVERESLAPGEGEIGISIPTPPGQRLLRDLASITRQWDRNLNPFVELFDPEHNPIVVRTIASSDWQFYLEAAPQVLLGISAAIAALNEILRNAIDTKKLMAELMAKGLPAESVQPAIDAADQRIETETRALAERMVDERQVDETRVEELKTHLTISMKFIAREMASNVSIEVRLLAPTSESPGNGAIPNSIDEAARIETLVETAGQIERNMNLAQLDVRASALLNLPAPKPDDNSV